MPTAGVELTLPVTLVKTEVSLARLSCLFELVG
jgi:hypothetical protein